MFVHLPTKIEHIQKENIHTLYIIFSIQSNGEHISSYTPYRMHMHAHTNKT
jgi:hypothetical protein